MTKKSSWSWVPTGVIAAVLLTIAVAWAFHDRAARVDQCNALYAAATTLADSAAVDTVRVPGVWTGVDQPCGELTGR